MNSSESVFPKKNRYTNYLPPQQQQQQSQSQQHNQNDIRNSQQDSKHNIHQLPKAEYPDPEVEETIKRLTAQTDNIRKFPEKLTQETNDEYQKRILQMTISIKQQPEININEPFELSIEELDNASVNQLLFPQPGGTSTSVTSGSPTNNTVTKKQRHIYESPEARARRLARNAERMRERRSNESEEEYRIRLAKMAAASRMRRQNESDLERTMRHVRDAARQRLRRAMESAEQRGIRLAKLAARAKYMRQNETPDQRAERLRKLAQHHRERYNRQKEAQKNGEPLKDSRKTPASSGTFLSSPTNAGASTSKLQNVSSTTFPASGRPQDFAGQPPSSSSSGASYGSEPPASTHFHDFEQTYPPYHLFRTNAFPELPPHLNPQTRATAASGDLSTAAGSTATGMFPPAHVSNFQELSQHLVNQYQHAKIIQQAAVPTVTPLPNTTLPSQYMPQNVPPIQVPSPQQMYRPSSATAAQQQLSTTYSMANQPPVGQSPFVRGRPVKIFPSNDYRNISSSLKVEADRQHTLNEMLEAQINKMLTSPKQSRGRPYKGRETDDDRDDRLRKMAETRKTQRDKETADERTVRLRDLAERARKRRELTMQTETEEERRIRLQKQSDYARQRRQSAQTPQAVRMAEERAKHLYTKIHDEPTTSTITQSSSNVAIKNHSGKDWTHYENMIRK